MKEKLQSTIEIPALAEYTSRQLNNFFPDGDVVCPESLIAGIEWTFPRLAVIHQAIGAAYYRLDGVAYFDHLHSDQQAAYLYLLSRHAFLERGERRLATKLYLLNKVLHALDLYFEVVLPEIFLLSHPVGTVLGRAQYGNYLVVSQNCTVGNIDDIYPTIGPGAVLGAGATILGRSRLGASVCVGAGSLLVNFTVPDGRTVVDRAGDARVLPRPSEKWRQYFRVPSLAV